MLDLDLDHRLGAELRAVVEGEVPSDRLDDLVGRKIRRRERRRLVGVGGGVALALVLLVGMVAVLGDDGPSAPDVTAGGEAGGDNLFLVPGEVPDGLELVHASGGNRPGEADVVVDQGPWDVTRRWGAFDGTGRLGALVDVQWATGGTARDVLSGESTRPVTVRGHQGVYAGLDTPPLMTTGAVVWEEADGLTVMVTVWFVEAGDRSNLLNVVASGLVPGADGGFGLPEGFEGLELLGEWPGVASEGTNPRVLVYQGDDGRGFQLQVVSDSELPPAMNLHEPGARYDDEFGPGVLTPTLAVPSRVEAPEWRRFLDDAQLHLQWTDSRGVRVTLGGVGLSEAELRAIARGLVPVDAETWFALQSGDDPEEVDPTDPATSTTAAPEVTPTSAAPAEVPADAVQVSGTYEGTEHYVLTEEASCAVESVLDATYTLTDGTTWQHHADYCGDLEGDMWVSPGGTFSFTLPDGSTLTGTMPEQEVPADDDGEPYQLTITGGTGSHAGASGTCDLDNHLEDIALGVQQQTGTFTCALAP